RAYLDVIAQSQAHDERWYTCVDKAYLEKTRDYSLESFEACDGGSFRGVEVLVDGKPAGLAPVYPWIFTGGVAPHLWLPTPAIQTTNFIPARVDLTPFAGLFDDGKPHAVAVRVPGADHFFNVAANLLVYQDPHAGPMSGALTRDTLATRQPAGLTVHDTLHADAAGRIVGTIDTDQTQTYVIAGRLHTPRGDIDTTVRYTGGFHNHQTFARPGARRYDETIDQLGSMALTVQRTLDGRPLDGYTVEQRDPLFLSSRKAMLTTGQDFTAQVAMKQGHRIETRRTDAQGATYHAVLDENLAARDHADGKTIPDPLDRTTFPHDEAGSEQVSFTDSLGSCYRAAIQSRDERLTAAGEGSGCPGNANRLDSRSRPDHPWLAPLGGP
ncbi:MAG TPA: peptide-N4-asparagine amidase, partial [Rhodanobacter sp.]